MSKEIIPDFIAEITLYPTERGGRKTPIGAERNFGCPCKLHLDDKNAWDCRILNVGEIFHPGETKIFGMKFLSPEIAPVFRAAPKFYLWELRIIGEARALPPELE